ncbi:hypothetical protein niasHS_007883 [Heterodera schachtii]|uniref:Uncharacterized protein n=1 Tax=Heterodera schachtii TaxID=97005 RepID=A0ABD2JPZ2_HETSC
MCFSSKIENTRKNCRFMFEQPCQCPPNQLEAIKFSKVTTGRKGGGQACCLIMCGIFGLSEAVTVRWKYCTDVHRVAKIRTELMIEVDYFGGSRRYDRVSYDDEIRQRTRYRTRTYSAWGQYTEKVEKTELQQGRMTMKNFDAVERKFDVMSVIQDNYYKTTDDWTDTFIRHLE